MTTCLGLVQAAMGEMGLTVPTTVIGNTDLQVTQILAILNQSGNELQREHEWEALTVEYRFTVQFLSTTGDLTASSAVVTAIPTTAQLSTAYMLSGVGVNQDTYISSVDSLTRVTLNQAATTSGTSVALTFGQTKYTLPTDYDRQIDRTHWDKSKHWQMLGPETAQQWQWLKSGYISTGPRIRYRILGSTFQIWPLTPTAEYLGFEYITKNWVAATGTTTLSKTAFSVDTDTCIFPDRLIINDLKRKYFAVKGFDAGVFNSDFQRELLISKASQAGSPTLSFMPQNSQVLIDWNNIPDSSYGT